MKTVKNNILDLLRKTFHSKNQPIRDIYAQNPYLLNV